MPQLAPLYWFFSFCFFWSMVLFICSIVWWMYSFNLRFPSFSSGGNFKGVWKW